MKVNVPRERDPAAEHHQLLAEYAGVRLRYRITLAGLLPHEGPA